MNKYTHIKKNNIDIVLSARRRVTGITVIR